MTKLNNFCKPLKKKKNRMLSIQPGLHSNNDLHVGRKMATFQLFSQSGRAKDLSAPLYRMGLQYRQPTSENFLQMTAQSVQKLGNWVGQNPRPIPSQKMSRPGLGPTLPPIQWVLFSLAGGRQGSETYASPPTRTKVKNNRSCISTPSVCLHGMYRDIAFYRGADKSLARPGKKQATVTKL